MLAILVSLGLGLLQARPARAACGNWTSTDTALQGLGSGLILADWAQTLRFTQYPTNPRIAEMNPILGAHPSRARTNVLIAAGLLSSVVVACELTGIQRTKWQLVIIAAEAAAVSHNYSLGVGVRF